MPVYGYECKQCGVKYEEFRRVSDMDKVLECAICHSPTERFISASQARPVVKDYYDEGMGCRVTGPKQRMAEARARGLEPVG